MWRISKIFLVALFAVVPLNAQTLTFWVKADQITGLSDGGSVTTWQDQSVSGRNATAGSAATYKTGIIGGLPVVRFSASKLSTGSLSASQPEAVFIVGRNPTGLNRTYLDSGNDTLTIQTYSGIGGFQLSSDGNAHVVRSACDDETVPAIITAIYNGVSSLSACNGGNVATGNGGTGNVTGGIQLGTGPGWGYFAGDEGEVIFYSGGALTSDQRQLVEGYLAWKWSLQASLPGSHPWAACQPTTAPATPWTPSSGSWTAMGCSGVAKKVVIIGDYSPPLDRWSWPPWEFLSTWLGLVSNRL